MSNLHVAIVHDTPIPAIKYGGTERVIWWLGQALTSLGHRVTYIVPKGSSSSFANIVERHENDARISDLIPKDVDVVHSFATLHEELNYPLLVTIEGNGQVGEKFHPNTVFVSKNHAQRHNCQEFVHNGLNPADYPDYENSPKEDFCYFLAKAKWSVKNVKGAINISKKAKVPIKIMGGWRPSFSRKTKWLGMIGGQEKMKVLEKGSALLFPVRWHEPFGIAIIEALYTGSPVFGTPYGSLPELITSDVGFISKDSKELARGLENYKEFSKETCKNHVLDNFTHIHMANKYLNYYEHVISGKNISKETPKTIGSLSPQALLDFS